MEPKTPCYNCGDRIVGCHSSCIAYIDWKKIHDEIVSKEKLERQIDLRASGYLNTSMIKRVLR